MRQWMQNVTVAIKTVGQGMYITLWYFLQTYKRKAFTQHFEYPELPVPVKPRYRGFHRFDLTTCIGCDKCARACPVDCIYIEKIKNPVGKGFRVNGFKIDYTKCMFCALCVDPCPVDCIFMGSTHDQSCFSRDGCIVDFAKLPVEIAWGQATLNPTAVAASKLVSRAGLDEAARSTAAAEAAPRPRQRRQNLADRMRKRVTRTASTTRINPWPTKRKNQEEIFHAAEANATLPLVRAIVRDIVDLAVSLAERQQRLVELAKTLARSIEAHQEEIQQIVAEFERDQERMKEYEAGAGRAWHRTEGLFYRPDRLPLLDGRTRSLSVLAAG